MRGPFPGQSASPCHVAARQRQMVVLDQDAVRQALPMIPPSSERHRPFFQGPQPRRRLPGIDDSGLEPLHRVAEFRRQRGDAGQPLQKIQGHALALQHGPAVAGDREGGGPGRDPVAVGEVCGAFQRRVHLRKDFHRDGQSGYDKSLRLLGENRPTGRNVRSKQGLGRDIARSTVFG